MICASHRLKSVYKEHILLTDNNNKRSKLFKCRWTNKGYVFSILHIFKYIDIYIYILANYVHKHKSIISGQQI